jgi:DNA-binding MarR family transcriptional regulator
MPWKPTALSGPRWSRTTRGQVLVSYSGPMGFQAAPFDVVEASRLVWLENWDPSAASGMAVYTSILRSYQLLNDSVNVVMRRHDLTFARYEVLAWLATDPESSLTLSWISKTLRIPPATVTNIIDRLESDKLVRRESHPSDARTTLAVITARGQKVVTGATEDLNATVYQTIGLTEQKRNQLIELLSKLRASGNEFDIARSEELIEDVGTRRAKKIGRGPDSSNGAK